MREEVMEFGRRMLTPERVRGKTVLEVGACDVNGSLRADVEALGPALYVGVDMSMGRGVDKVADAEALRKTFPRETFDIVIATELAEHVRNWRPMVRSLKEMLAPNGTLLFTTCTIGFYYHAYPYDFWRYEGEDVEAIFADMDTDRLEVDNKVRGVFYCGRKTDRPETDLSGIQLYSIVKRRHALDVTDEELARFQLVYRLRRRFWKIWPKALRFGAETDWV